VTSSSAPAAPPGATELPKAYSPLVGCLVAFLGAVVGIMIGVALTFALLRSAEADAFTWLAGFVFFGLVGGALGTTAALVWHDVRKRRRRRGQGYDA